MIALFLSVFLSAPAEEMYAECAKTCTTCAAYCEGKGEKHAVSAATCHDCALICTAASKATGPLAPIIQCAAADACTSCAIECEKMPDDKQMTKCAKACRECAKMGPEKIGKPKAAKRHHHPVPATCKAETTCVAVDQCSGRGHRKHRLRNLLHRLRPRRGC